MERKYSERVIEALHEMLGVGLDETVAAVRRLWSTNEIFDTVVAYYGGAASGSEIRSLVTEIYAVDLSKCEDV